MPENNNSVTFNIREFQYLECCDCGLVHEVEYEIHDDGIILMTYTRKDERTEKARIKRAGGKGKLMCRLLDEATLKEPIYCGHGSEY